MRKFLENKISYILIIAGFVLAMGVLMVGGEPPFVHTQKSVVKLSTEEGSGTGFLTRTGKGHAVIVTNWHVCQASPNGFFLAERDGDGISFVTMVLAVNPYIDLCILSSIPGTPLELGEKPRYFQHLYTVGHPQGGHAAPSSGYYLGPINIPIVFPPTHETCLPGFNIVQDMFGRRGCEILLRLQDTSIVIYPGNSGSPVVDYKGRVVGVVNAGSNSTHFAAMVSLEDLIAFLKEF